MFVVFEDLDGDELALNVNHIVGFEFKEGEPTKVQLVTGTLAKVKDDKTIVMEKFREIHIHADICLFWDFKMIDPEQNVATPK